ncbi:hypothetical protein ACFSM5_20300 [Lacibacterium aquatile]|uniref:Uncharacterized protein n=1 Tax=Lacibacterium aquatile TaxID=1168082 RepID=A0ABW5DXU2_9PROT
MRIIYSDIQRLKSAAKHLVVCSQDIKLSAAQEALARASGYRDWHELSASSFRYTKDHASSAEIDANFIARLAGELSIDVGDVQLIVARTKLIDNQAWTDARHQACQRQLYQLVGGLTDAQIDQAKTTAIRSGETPHHEHRDCIRIAYEWLDAQVKIKSMIRKPFAIKHIIEKWAGRYVSASDVDVAAFMHPDIRGIYPYFNISSRLTEPSRRRLDNIEEAFTQRYARNYNPKIYSRKEE